MLQRGDYDAIWGGGGGREGDQKSCWIRKLPVLIIKSLLYLQCGTDQLATSVVGSAAARGRDRPSPPRCQNNEALNQGHIDRVSRRIGPSANR